MGGSKSYTREVRKMNSIRARTTAAGGAVYYPVDTVNRRLSRLAAAAVRREKQRTGDEEGRCE
jgi:hypothetical protein